MTAQPTSLSLLDLLSHAGPMGKFILFSLLAISVLCWTVVFTKWTLLRKTTNDNHRFLQFFWQSKSMDDIYIRIDQYTGSTVAAVFKSGMKELRKLNGVSSTSSTLELENIQRALQRSSNEETANLEKHVTWLATTASAAPFIGLFGTVWGIMTSFQGIGASGSANLAVVAPGISEALIATAAGIGAAIPAAIFYNYFLNQIKRIAIDMDGFQQDFLNIIRRSQIQQMNPQVSSAP
jgi:biopolymer transport protein TolQ